MIERTVKMSGGKNQGDLVGIIESVRRQTGRRT
jgi:hypothetical protein